MTAAFSTVFVFALIVNIIATLWSSFRGIFCGRAWNDATPGQGGKICASRERFNEERRKSEEIAKRYLPVYLLAVFSDWVKGPYGYELYSSSDCYGYSPREIYLLCSVVPFVSSIVFGTFVCGPIADNGFDFRSGRGRKQMAMVFVLVTVLSNITKHFRNFKASVVGSVLEGISTSLLFTVFDSWLVRSYPDRAAKSSSSSTKALTPSLQLSRILATAEFRNNIVAISAGWIATLVTGVTEFGPFQGTTKELGDDAIFHVGGVLNPFDLSSFSLLLCALLIQIFWEENHGGELERENKSNHQSEGKVNEATSPLWQRYRFSLVDAFITAMNSKEIIFAGIVCSLFESAMFIFVFTWTNVIASRIEGEQEIPFTLIFATFMFGCMTGTSVFTILIDDMKIATENIGKGLLFLAICAFLGMIFATSTFSSMIAFFLFELSVGVYFPMMGTMKSETVPENHRTTIYNIYRVPFNIIMIIFLSYSDDSSSYLSLYPELPFAICACMVGAAFFFQMRLCKFQEERKLYHSETLSLDLKQKKRS